MAFNFVSFPSVWVIFVAEQLFVGVLCLCVSSLKNAVVLSSFFSFVLGALPVCQPCYLMAI